VNAYGEWFVHCVLGEREPNRDRVHRHVADASFREPITDVGTEKPTDTASAPVRGSFINPNVLCGAPIHSPRMGIYRGNGGV